MKANKYSTHLSSDFSQNLNPPSLTLREGKKNCHPEFFAEKYRRVN
ncbi:MAG: hypothetical protein PHR06_05425 [Candidatus Cloacimonetes bacterium]|nr:hypothetical protein [Candidatus Cloacimonadota bacterium]